MLTKSWNLRRPHPRPHRKKGVHRAPQGGTKEVPDIGLPAPVETGGKDYTSNVRIYPRRAVSAILAAALLSGSMPPGASAQVARVAAGQTGAMPVSPAGGFAAAPPMSPPASTIGAATLEAGLTAAPSSTPSPIAPHAAAPPASVHAAPVEHKTWKQRLASMLGLKPGSSTTPAAEAPSFEAAKAGDGTFDGAVGKIGSVDGPAVSGGGVAAPPTSLKAAILARYASRKTPAAAERAANSDEFGGPKLDAASTNAVRYGLKWGLNMVGISALIDVLIRPLLNAFAWPLHLSEEARSAFGRVVLMVKAGPADITSRIAESPLQFFGLDLPSALVAEEFFFRLIGFGATALLLAGLKPASRRLSGLLKGLPDAAGAAGGAQSLLKIGEWLSGRAFPIAAAMSAVSFAIAHFDKWGISPYVLLSNLILGLVLARTAYAGRALPAPRWAQWVFLGYLAYAALLIAPALLIGVSLTMPALGAVLVLGLVAAHALTTRGALELGNGLFNGALAVGRGLIAPFTAHLVFNLAAVGAIAVGLAFSASASLAYSIIIGLLGVSALLYNYLSAQKDNAFKLKHGVKALAALLIVGAGLSMWSGTPQGPSNETASRTMVSSMQAPSSVGTIPATAPADTAVVESREAMIARVKDSVVRVLVRMPQGMGSGSGFILTPDGVFITNAHVLGPRQSGQFVEAFVPGTPDAVKAKVLAVNHDKDIAIVQLAPRADGGPWPTVKLAAHAPQVGSAVIAAGYPRGLPLSFTAGIVSGTNDRDNMYVKRLQTDAPMNPGNSGGPLFSMEGEVVGVNTEIYSASGGSNGLGFVIIAPEVNFVMMQYAKTGNIATASLGIISDLSDPMAPKSGLAIEYVRGGSAAEKAGLKRGDLIIGVGGETISEGGREAAGHVAAALSKMIPGEETTVKVLREDSPLEFTLSVDAKVTRTARGKSPR